MVTKSADRASQIAAISWIIPFDCVGIEFLCPYLMNAAGIQVETVLIITVITNQRHILKFVTNLG